MIIEKLKTILRNPLGVSLLLVIVALTSALSVYFFTKGDSKNDNDVRVLAEEQVRVPVTGPDGVPVTTPEGEIVYEVRTIVRNQRSDGETEQVQTKNSNSSNKTSHATKAKITTTTKAPVQPITAHALDGAPGTWDSQNPQSTYEFPFLIYVDNPSRIDFSYVVHYKNRASTQPKKVKGRPEAQLTYISDTLTMPACDVETYWVTITWEGGSTTTNPATLQLPYTQGMCGN